MQIEVLRILHAVLGCCRKGVSWDLLGVGGQALGCSPLLFPADFGAAFVAAFVLAFRVIQCPTFFFGAAFGFGFGSFA